MDNSKSQVREWKYTGVTTQNPSGNDTIYDVVKTSFVPACHIKRISKTEYLTGHYRSDGVFISDGEVFEVAKKEEHMRNRRSLRAIFRTLRQLIATNFSGGDSELFLTLTYADQHNDPQRIYTDIKKFWQKLRRRNPNLKHISIVEPHASGMFHVHMLLSDTSGDYLYIPDAEIADMWGHGHTKTERLNDIDHMGAYFIAYFTNLDLSPEEIKIYEAEEDIEYRNGKAVIKGKRLDYYPEWMQIYRYSRNCDKPEKSTDFDGLEQLEGATKTYEHEHSWEDDGKTYTVRTEQWRKKGDNLDE